MHTFGCSGVHRYVYSSLLATCLEAEKTVINRTVQLINTSEICQKSGWWITNRYLVMYVCYILHKTFDYAIDCAIESQLSVTLSIFKHIVDSFLQNSTSLQNCHLIWYIFTRNIQTTGLLFHLWQCINYGLISLFPCCIQRGLDKVKASLHQDRKEEHVHYHHKSENVGRQRKRGPCVLGC